MVAFLHLMRSGMNMQATPCQEIERCRGKKTVEKRNFNFRLKEIVFKLFPITNLHADRSHTSKCRVRKSVKMHGASVLRSRISRPFPLWMCVVVSASLRWMCLAVLLLLMRNAPFSSQRSYFIENCLSLRYCSIPFSVIISALATDIAEDCQRRRRCRRGWRGRQRWTTTTSPTIMCTNIYLFGCFLQCFFSSCCFCCWW